MITQSDFRPALGLSGPHQQTLWPSLLRHPIKPPIQRERLELPDGDFLDLDWLKHSQDLPDRPTVLVVHGLEGSLDSHYATGIMHALWLAGLRAVVLHFRGCSGVPNRLPRSYHSGETGDLHTVVTQLHARYSHSPLAILGYSIGGNVLLKWLGEQETDAPVATAVAVSVPFALADAADRLDHGFSRLYQWHLLRKLRAAYRRKFRDRPADAPVPLAELSSLRTFRQFDDRITAPLHGFDDVSDYYRRASSRPFLGRIRMPTLILHAADDPFMTIEAIPSAEELSPTTTLELSTHGGHVGFVTGSIPARPRYWLEERILRHLNRAFERCEHGKAG